MAASPTANRRPSSVRNGSPPPATGRLRDRVLGGGGPDAVRAGQGQHGPGSCELLEPARVVDADVAHQRCPGEGHEADLTGSTGEPPVEVSADHDRRTHAFLTPQQDEVLAAPGGAQGELGHRGEVDVVVEVTGIATASRSRSSRLASCQPGRCRA